MVSADEGWAVGDVGTILRWDGTEWQLYRSSVLAYRGIDMVSATDGWIVGNHGVIVRWQADGGDPSIVHLPYSFRP
jgi:hypothetical protein